MNVPFSQLRQQDNLLSFYMLIADSSKQYKKWSTFSFHLSANKNFCWSPRYLRFWKAKHQLSVKGHWWDVPRGAWTKSMFREESHMNSLSTGRRCTYGGMNVPPAWFGSRFTCSLSGLHADSGSSRSLLVCFEHINHSHLLMTYSLTSPKHTSWWWDWKEHVLRHTVAESAVSIPGN